jgi:hypothetical protein
LQKYHISFWVVAALMVVIVLASAAGNCFLALSKERILTHVNQLNPVVRITVGNMFFLFPNKVILQNVVLKDEKLVPTEDVLVFKNLVIKFSIQDIFKKKLSVSQVIIGSPKCSHKNMSLFFQKHFETIKAVLKNRTRKDICVLIRKGNWGLAGRGQDTFYIANEVTLGIKGNAIFGSGLLKRVRHTLKNDKSISINEDSPLSFDFDGTFHAKGFALNRLIVEKDHMYANLWGNQVQNFFRLNGFAFVNSPSREVVPHKLSNLSGREIKSMSLMQKGIFILDIDAVLQWAWPEMEIRHFNFFLNHAPFRLNGRLNFTDALALDLACSIENPPLGGLMMKNFEKADFKIRGDMKNNGFNGEGDVQIDLFAYPHSNVGVEKITGEFKGMRVDFDAYSRLCLYLQKGVGAFWTNNNEHRISFQDWRVICNFLQPKFKIIQTEASLYGGILQARGWVDTTRSAKTNAVCLLSDLDANQLDELLIHFSKVQGRLFSNLRLSLGSELNIDGEIDIKKGRLQNFDFFNWMADSFELPSLKEIEFKKTAMGFSVNHESAGLNKIQLEAEDLSLDGYFYIDKKGLVASKLAMGFPKDFLQTSPKLRRIVNIFDEQVHQVIFDFQLSGNQHAMNFQWLDSEHKRKIQEIIPDFIERIIERRVNKAMQTAIPQP